MASRMYTLPSVKPAARKKPAKPTRKQSHHNPSFGKLCACHMGRSGDQDTFRVIGQALDAGLSEYPANKVLGLLVVPHFE